MLTWGPYSHCLLIIDQAFSESADHTAHWLADIWLEYAKHTGSVLDSKSVSRSQAQPSGTSSSLRSWSLPAQTTEMAQAGLDLSFLSPFLPEPDLDPPHVFPLQKVLALILILKNIFRSWLLL